MEGRARVTCADVGGETARAPARGTGCTPPLEGTLSLGIRLTFRAFRRLGILKS